MREPWYVRPTGAHGPATHALIIATSQYKHLPEDPKQAGTYGLSQLRSACLGSYRLAVWMRDHAENFTPPIGTIRLLMSPADVETQTIRNEDTVSKWLTTEPSSVREALWDWKASCGARPGNVAFLYVAGHGYLSPESLAVFTHESLEREREFTHTLGVSQINHALAWCPLKASLIFIDACQDIPKGGLGDVHLEPDIRLDPPVTAIPDSREVAPIYYASSVGGSAFGHRDVGSYFSNALMDCLEYRAAVHTDPDWNHWAITVASLGSQLRKAVELQTKRPQSPIADGVIGLDVPFYNFPSRPKMKMALRFRPPDRPLKSTHLELADWDGRLVKRTHVEVSRWPPLQCGTYNLSVNRGRPIPFAHEPPEGASRVVDLP